MSLGNKTIPYHPSQQKIGPSQQRRRERRAAARQAAAEQAEATLSEEEKDVLKKAEKADLDYAAGKAVIEAEVKCGEKETETPAVEEKEITEQVNHNDEVGKEDTIIDEFCSNASFEEGKSTPTPIPQSTSRPIRGLGSVDYFAMFEDFCNNPD